MWYSSTCVHMSQKPQAQWLFHLLRYTHRAASLCAILFRIVSQREAIVEMSGDFLDYIWKIFPNTTPFWGSWGRMAS